MPLVDTRSILLERGTPRLTITAQVLVGLDDVITYTGYDGTTQEVTVKATLSDKAKRHALRFAEWMRKYPVTDYE